MEFLAADAFSSRRMRRNSIVDCAIAPIRPPRRRCVGDESAQHTHQERRTTYANFQHSARP